MIASRPSMPYWLTHLGVFGLATVAVIDSSVIPLPLPGSTDLLLLWLVAHGAVPWQLAPVAIAGSLLGGYTTWRLGKSGGEESLRHYIPAPLLRRIVAWVQKHPLLSVFLPAVLPPPIPLSPFVLASGALGVSRNRFLIVFGIARSLRYCCIGWLGAVYGRHIVRLWSATLEKISGPLLWGFWGMVVVTAGAGLFKLRSLHRKSAARNLRFAGTASAESPAP